MKNRTNEAAALTEAPAGWEHSPGAAQYEKSHRLPAATGQKRILVVDDETFYAELIKMHLEETNRYEAEVVSDSNRVMEVAKAFNPDLILLDIVMPGKDGGDVAAQLRMDRQLKNVPVIFVTALVSSSETDNGEAVVRKGGKLMLSKPVSSRLLIKTLDTMLQGGPPHPPSMRGW